MSSAISTRESETLPLKWLQAYSEGCVVICPMTDHSWDDNHQSETIQAIQNACQTVYIGISRPGGVKHHAENDILKIAEETETTITAYHESRYIAKEDSFAFEVATAIRSGYKLNDPSRPKSEIHDAYVPEEEELSELVFRSARMDLHYV